MKIMQQFTLYLLVALLSGSALVVHGQIPVNTSAFSLPTNYHLYSHPNLGNGVTQVELQVYFNSLTDLNDVDQSASFDIYLDYIWTDGRFAWDLSTNQIESMEIEDEDVLKTLWHPTFEISNQAGEKVTVSNIYSVEHDGRVLHTERIFVTTSQNFDLTKFPFLTHSLSFDIHSFGYDKDDVIISTSSAAHFLSNMYGDSTWCAADISSSISEATHDVIDHKVFSTMTITFTVSRIPTSMIFVVCFPLVLMVLICWLAFFVKHESIDVRLGMSITSFLTVVAFSIVFTDSMPPISYLTWLHYYVMNTYLFVGAAIIMHVFIHYAEWIALDVYAQIAYWKRTAFKKHKIRTTTRKKINRLATPRTPREKSSEKSGWVVESESKEAADIPGVVPEGVGNVEDSHLDMRSVTPGEAEAAPAAAVADPENVKEEKSEEDLTLDLKEEVEKFDEDEEEMKLRVEVISYSIAFWANIIGGVIIYPILYLISLVVLLFWINLESNLQGPQAACDVLNLFPQPTAPTM